MPILQFVFFGSLAAVSAGLAVASHMISVPRKMKRTPRVGIGDAPSGETVRICGVVRVFEDQPLTAPLSRRPCAAWSIRIRAERAGGLVEEVAHHQTVQAFYVDEGDDTALVVGPEIRLDMVIDRGETVAHLDQNLHDFLSAQHILLVDGLRYMIEEGVIELGETVSVVGQGRWEVDPSRAGAGYREVGRHYRIEGLDGEQVFVSDDTDLAAST